MLARMDTLLLLGTTSMPKLAQLALKITCKIVLIMQEVREAASEHTHTTQHIAPFILYMWLIWVHDCNKSCQ